MTEVEKKAILIIKKEIEELQQEIDIEICDKDFHDEPHLAYLIQQKETRETLMNLLSKKDKVIDLMSIELYNYANLNILHICDAELGDGTYDMGLCRMTLETRNCCQCIKQHFYKEVEGI